MADSGITFFLSEQHSTIRNPMGTNKVKAYYDEAYPPVPSKGTLYWRKNLLWQLVRFVVLNVKIMRVVVGGHS